MEPVTLDNNDMLERYEREYHLECDRACWHATMRVIEAKLHTLDQVKELAARRDGDWQGAWSACRGLLLDVYREACNNQP